MLVAWRVLALSKNGAARLSALGMSAHAIARALVVWKNVIAMVGVASAKTHWGRMYLMRRCDALELYCLFLVVKGCCCRR